MNERSKAVFCAIVTLSAAACATSTDEAPVEVSESAATGGDIAGLASANLGKHYCDRNSLGGSGFETSCNGEAWCADFAKWVWRNLGLNVGGLNAAAGSFYLYGERNGTLHSSPAVGDAVVFQYNGRGYADHVGLVNQVFGDGTIQVINGNFGGSSTTSSVQYSRGPGRIGAAIAGQTISGFISPVGLSQPPPATNPRIGIVQGGFVNIKEGNLFADWFDEKVSGIQDLQLSGNRLGVLTAQGHALVKEGPLNAFWHDQMDNVKTFRLSGNRIGILRAEGTVFIKEGSLDDHWNDEGVTGIQDIQLSGDRIGILTAQGHALVKEGPWNADWHDEMDNVKAFRLSGNRIGILKTDGTVFIKEGGLDEHWNDEGVTGIQDIQLSGDRIGVLTAQGHALVKEGPWNANWHDEMNDVKAFRLSGNRIGILKTAGTVFIKEGGLDDGWVDELVTNVSTLELTQ